MTPTIEIPELVSLADRLAALGVTFSRAESIQAGKRLAGLYRDRYDREPLEAARTVDGWERRVRVYEWEDIDLIDQAISSVASSLPLTPNPLPRPIGSYRP